LVKFNRKEMGMFDLFRKKPQQPDWLSGLPKEIADMFLQEIRSNPQASKTDTISEGIGKFGLEITNPIPVYGIPSNEFYLGNLMFSNGGRITYRRIGSSEVSNIEKSIDKYEIFNFQGETVCYLYLSPYHWKTSHKVPDGFKFK
jgi:hypothetical protein